MKSEKEKSEDHKRYVLEIKPQQEAYDKIRERAAAGYDEEGAPIVPRRNPAIKTGSIG